MTQGFQSDPLIGLDQHGSTTPVQENSEVDYRESLRFHVLAMRPFSKAYKDLAHLRLAYSLSSFEFSGKFSF